MNNTLLRKIPKTDVILSLPAIRAVCGSFPYEIVKETVKDCADALRRDILSGASVTVPTAEELAETVIQKLKNGDIYSLKRVINATGVVLHTNLGRAPLGREVAEHIAAVASGYSNLEYDLEKGERGSRYSHVEKLICDLTGAEAATVVNNNAGAVFLMLNTLCEGKKVAVSRGELVEIGGSFRVPEIMARSGAELIEIGTTNKTHPYDYIDAAEAGASVFLKVHTSNFRIEGFTESVEIEKLAETAKEKGVMLLYDLGSGFLFPCEYFGLHDEGDMVGKCLRAGADVVCFSGDKLLGSGQAGIIAGRKEYIDLIKKNHLTRMLRIDKLSLAALEFTLRHSTEPSIAAKSIPALNMLSRTEEQCREIAKNLADGIAEIPGAHTELVRVQDEPGGGSLPGVLLDGAAVSLWVERMETEALEKALRGRRIPIIARVSRDSVLFSARTLFEGDAEEITAAVREIAEAAKAGRA